MSAILFALTVLAAFGAALCVADARKAATRAEAALASLQSERAEANVAAFDRLGRSANR